MSKSRVFADLSANMIRGIILNIETYNSYYVPRKYCHQYSVQMKSTHRRRSFFFVYKAFTVLYVIII